MNKKSKIDTRKKERRASDNDVFGLDENQYDDELLLIATDAER
jgi:hypothetical protein